MILTAMSFLTKTAQFICIGLLCVASLSPVCLSANEWSYDDHHGDGPKDWQKTFPDCGLSEQSPIDIRTSVSKYKEMTEINFEGYSQSQENSYTLANNGHTVQLTVTNGDMKISGAELPGKYKLVQFHVHWGSNNSIGSEHTVNGRSYPMEIHLVHYNSDRYGSIDEALTQRNGLAVIGFFAQIGEKSHKVMTKLIDKFCAVKYSGSNATGVGGFAMADLLPENRKPFYRYYGSLTTPGCQQSVLWTVLREPIVISKTQLNAFRALGHYAENYKRDAPMEDNFRPVQPLGDRILLRSHQQLSAAETSDHVSVVASTATALLSSLTVIGITLAQAQVAIAAILTCHLIR